METGKKQVTRRDFLKGTAAVAATAALAGAGAHYVYAAGSDLIKVGLIGCGGRGNGAANDCVKSSQNVQIWAAGDIFPEKLGGPAKAHNIPQERCFGGVDAYQKVIGSGVNMIILATPPGFRPGHFEAAIKAGKHVFMEKPVCVDPTGYRKVVAAAEMATQKKLCVVAGTQRRHTNSYRECIKRIHAGDMGEIVSAQCYWIGGPVTHNRPRTPGMGDIEWQIRNWYAWSWTCGDHICEQHVHNLDVILWAIGAVPVKAIGVGGRQARPEPGNIFDHFAIEFEFPNNVRVASYCAHFTGINGRVSEAVEGTKGKSGCSGSISNHAGEKIWNFQGENPNGYVQEHADLIAAIRGGAYINEGKQVADSTMTAVLGRMCAYTGREIKWDWAVNQSKLDLMPPQLDLKAKFEPPPVAIPGKTELV
ncbi:MAG: Gfo/Idh/MocA family oxidoreductase [Planctomycetes bacterium]|nr:Gfo/Idh/MocA family oxidoreductase [Planctomycetota bacterium]